MVVRHVLDPDEVRYLQEIQERLESWGEEDGATEAEDAGEERLALVESVLREVQGELPRVMRDPVGSRVLQRILPDAGNDAASAAICALFSGGDERVVETMKHPTGSFVLETMVHRAFHGSEDTRSHFVQFATRLEKRQLFDLLTDSRGSFVLRGLIACLADVEIDKAVPSVESDHASLPATSLSDASKAALTCIVESLGDAGSELGRSLRMPHVCGTMSVLAASAGRADPALLEAIAAVTLGQRLDFLEQHATWGPSSRLVEAIVVFCRDDFVAHLYQSHLRGRLPELARHPIANHVLQRYLLRAGGVSSGLVLEALDELEELLAETVQLHAGVVVALARACRQASDDDCRKRFVRAMRRMTQDCGGLVEGVRYYQGGAAGSLIVQNMLQFGGMWSDPVETDLRDMARDGLRKLATDPKWSHVLEAFFSNQRIEERRKEKVRQALQGELVTLAKDPGGSRVLESAYSFAVRAETRRRIVEELALGIQALRDDTNGRFVVRRCRVEEFLSRKDRWDQEEDGRDAKKRVFAEFLDEEHDAGEAADSAAPAAAKKRPRNRHRKKAREDCPSSDPVGKVDGIMETLGFPSRASKVDRDAAAEQRPGQDGETESVGLDPVLSAIARASSVDAPAKKTKKLKKKRRPDRVSKDLADAEAEAEAVSAQ